MPISYSIDPERRLVLTKAWGVLTDNDLLQHKENLARDPAFSVGMRELSDVREIQRLDVTSTGVRAMVAHDDRRAHQSAQHRMALVVPNDEVFGMARMYQTMGAPDNPVRIFRNLQLAEAWLLEGES
jgi:hypothetical protein